MLILYSVPPGDLVADDSDQGANLLYVIGQGCSLEIGLERVDGPAQLIGLSVKEAEIAQFGGVVLAKCRQRRCTGSKRAISCRRPYTTFRLRSILATTTRMAQARSATRSSPRVVGRYRRVVEHNSPDCKSRRRETDRQTRSDRLPRIST